MTTFLLSEFPQDSDYDCPFSPYPVLCPLEPGVDVEYVFWHGGGVSVVGLKLNLLRHLHVYLLCFFPKWQKDVFIFLLFGFSSLSFCCWDFECVRVLCMAGLPLPSSDWVVCVSGNHSWKEALRPAPRKVLNVFYFILLSWEGDGYRSVGLGDVLVV